MRTWSKTFLYPMSCGRKAKVQASFIDQEDGSKPQINYRIPDIIQRMKMKPHDYELLHKVLSDLFTYLREGKELESYTEGLKSRGGPKIPFREKLAIAKRSWERARRQPR